MLFSVQIVNSGGGGNCLKLHKYGCTAAGSWWYSCRKCDCTATGSVVMRLQEVLRFSCRKCGGAAAGSVTVQLQGVL